MLPNRNNKFDLFIAPAQRHAEPWRTGLGMVLIICITIATIVLMGLVFFAFVQPRPAEIDLTSKIATFLSLCAILLVLPSIWVVLRFIHFRPVATLIAPNCKIKWKAFMLGAGILAAATMLIDLPGFTSGKFQQQLDLAVWMAWLAPTVVVIFLQTTIEEMVFRGYLLQQFAVLFKSRWIWWFLPSLMFGMLHFDSAVFGQNAWLVVVLATFTGLIFSDITIRTGNLSAAMGLHFANNLVSVLVLGMPGSLSALSLFLRDTDIQNIAQTRQTLLISLGLMLGGYLIYLLVMRRRR